MRRLRRGLWYALSLLPLKSCGHMSHQVHSHIFGLYKTNKPPRLRRHNHIPRPRHGIQIHPRRPILRFRSPSNEQTTPIRSPPRLPHRQTFHPQNPLQRAPSRRINHAGTRPNSRRRALQSSWSHSPLQTTHSDPNLGRCGKCWPSCYTSRQRRGLSSHLHNRIKQEPQDVA